MTVNSLELAMFSLDPYCVFVEGEIISNGVFVGILYCSEFDIRKEYQ